MNRARRTSVPTEGWERILRVVGETFDAYLAGLPALRRRVVADLKRKLSDGGVLDHRCDRSTRTSPPAKKRT